MSPVSRLSAPRFTITRRTALAFSAVICALAFGGMAAAGALPGLNRDSKPSEGSSTTSTAAPSNETPNQTLASNGSQHSSVTHSDPTSATTEKETTDPSETPSSVDSSATTENESVQEDATESSEAGSDDSTQHHSSSSTSTPHHHVTTGSTEDKSDD